MPFINTKVNIEITKEQKDSIAKGYGKAISTIGKSEGWLMLGFEDNCDMYFKGDASKPMAYVDVSLYGGSSADSYSRMTGEITKLLSQQLGIAAENIYVKYSATNDWGWNGSNL